MVRKFQPVLAIIGLLAVIGWLALVVPGSSRLATAQPSDLRPNDSTLAAPRLADQFVVFDDEEDEEEGEEEGEEEDWDEDDERDEDGDEDVEYDEEEEGDEEWDEEEELEREMIYLELKRGELQALFGEMELVEQVTSIVGNADATAVLAIVSAVEEIDEPEQVEAFLLDMQQYAKSSAVKRLINLELAEVYGQTEQTGKALEVLRKIVADE